MIFLSITSGCMQVRFTLLCNLTVDLLRSLSKRNSSAVDGLLQINNLLYYVEKRGQISVLQSVKLSCPRKASEQTLMTMVAFETLFTPLICVVSVDTSSTQFSQRERLQICYSQ